MSIPLGKIFEVEKPVIGMIHLEHLEGPCYKGMEYVRNEALNDFYALETHVPIKGVDGLMVENWNEVSKNPFVSKKTAKRMEEVIRHIKEEAEMPVGVNVLHNDYRAAFRIGKNLNLDYVWLDVFIDRVRPDFKYTEVDFDRIEVDVQDLKANRKGSNTALFAGIHPKHYKPLGKEKSFEDSAQQAIDNGADAVVITKETRKSPAIEIVKNVKDYVGDFPVIVASGVNPDNVIDFLEIADGVIVGSYFKYDGKTKNPVDSYRVNMFMEKVS